MCLLCDPSVVDGKSGLGRVERVTTGGESARELLAFRRGDVVVRVRIVRQTELLAQTGMSVVRRHVYLLVGCSWLVVW